MAINLAHHGTMSMDDCDDCRERWVLNTPWRPGQPYRPTNYREPVPVLATAAGVLIVDALFGASSSPESYLAGPRARLLKYQNLLWLTLLSLGTFFAVRTLTGSFWLSLAGVVLVNLPSLRNYFGQIDDLATEIPATAMLIPASLSLTIAYARQRLSCYPIAGALFGVSALTKAIVLYVFLGIAAVLVGLFVIRRPVDARKAVRQLGLFGVAWAIIVVPWMARNYLELGTWQITQRGGESLWERALEDQINRHEYAGAFYLWAPYGIVQKWLGRALNLSAADIERGGRLQRLNSAFSSPLSLADRDGPVYAGRPDQTITLFRQAEAERAKEQREYLLAGHPHPDIAADQSMFSGAKIWIIRHPWRHLALTVAFLWRGAVTTLVMLVLTLIVAARRKSYELLLFVAPSALLIMLYALTSPFFSRYGEPARLIALLGLLSAIPALCGLAAEGRAPKRVVGPVPVHTWPCPPGNSA
jgi:hypothetical protein